jgi:hypothetical protein
MAPSARVRATLTSGGGACQSIGKTTRRSAGGNATSPEETKRTDAKSKTAEACRVLERATDMYDDQMHNTEIAQPMPSDSSRPLIR